MIDERLAVPCICLYIPVPEITYVNQRRCHEFKCAACGCKYVNQRYLNMKDKASTGNMLKHVKKCWGNKAWKAASECWNAAEARSTVTEQTASSGSITASFN